MYRYAAIGLRRRTQDLWLIRGLPQAMPEDEVVSRHLGLFTRALPDHFGTILDHFGTILGAQVAVILGVDRRRL